LEDIDTLLSKADKSFNLKNYDDAILLCDKILEKDPSNIQALTYDPIN
jgi:hypothetical protein